MKLLLLAVIGSALLVPASALAAEPTMVVRDLPVHASRSTAASTPTFDLVGFHWRGTGVVSYRARLRSGGWTAWRRVDDDDSVQAGWHLGNLDWTGAANAVRIRTRGSVSRVRAYYVSSPVAALPVRRLQVAGSPLVVSRFDWQADESIRRAAPRYSDAIHFAVVHHTAGSNSYTRTQSAAIVRGIEIYHVKGNGWNDIGYNFLVDKYGQVFEGRYGGVDRAVVGAHAQGFNTGSVGVAVLGSYGTSKISAAAKSSLEQLLAWKLDLAHVDPLSTLTWRSSGNPRFGSGVPVFLRAISGHRDTGFTDCPGNALYAELPQIGKEVALLGGPKIYGPLAVKDAESQVRFTAKLSGAQPWTVTVASSAGAQVAQGTGTGSIVDWTWDASTAPPDKYSWTIASPNARSASGSLGAVAALAVQKASAAPAEVAPGETTTLSYTLTVPATVNATLVSPAGDVLSTLLTAPKIAGAQTLAFTPQPTLPNGRYTVEIAAVSGVATALATIPIQIDDVLAGFSVAPTAATVTLARPPASIVLQLLRGATIVATPSLALAPGQQTAAWPKLRDGSYTAALTITDDVGTFTRSLPLTIDTTPPRVTVLSLRRLRFRVSEPATLLLTVGARTYRRVLPKPTTTQFWLKTPPARYVLTATDAAGNVSSVRYRR
jgi:N-acetylmuramoyl-L-alanine amidase